MENFYNMKAPFRFISDVIKYTFKGKVEIKEISEITRTEINSVKLEQLTKAILDETTKTFKSHYRSYEENLEVATTDAKLYLALHSVNDLPEVNSADILSGTHFLLTTSTRAIKCAQVLGYRKKFITKPSILVSLLEKIGVFHSTAAEVVNLFDNPFLIEAISNSWESVKILVNAGIELNHKNVVSLNWDLDEVIKNYITDKDNIVLPEENIEKEDVKDYFSFIRDIKAKGYKLIPEIDLLFQRLSTTEDMLAELKEREGIYLKEVQKFSQRKQRYLERLRKK